MRIKEYTLSDITNMFFVGLLIGIVSIGLVFSLRNTECDCENEPTSFSSVEVVYD